MGGCVSEGAVDLLRHDFDKNSPAKMAKKKYRKERCSNGECSLRVYLVICHINLLKE